MSQASFSEAIPGHGRLAVIGAGAWGTALAIQACRAGGEVALWARDPARALAMRTLRTNARHLPGYPLPPELAVTADAREALSGAALAVLAVPTQHLAAVLEELPHLPPCIIVAKGVEATTLRFPLEILAEARAGLSAAVLSGPNFAHEVAGGLPAAAVVASADAGLRAAAIARLGTPGFRLYAGLDPLGVQVAGAAKNVAAIAAGAAIGAGLGENARAAIVTRALAEIARLAVALGGRGDTVAGLAGLGDLMLTCAGASSRNFSLGVALGRGERAEEVLAGRSSVTEGAATAPALLARAAAAGVELPICAAVAGVLKGSVTVQGAMESLLGRPRRAE
ncbi:NAD(P)H-dependent glycerol-3-phosphate dehydrogenase [Pararoseomonas indoligenes]|uniref:Glycerol-3-phosphate dehydrogenase [NAD(P)+] n=1 Tax=Roseomonas indoligenes TaxID=2820811 RepID=A0A940MUS1_9PROT|nr:NAD(P)H-dependent glycerol-3-phosphate dehydrogenase [Pararoseomonas indoligenes]MBP0491612.1 NAD(P)H-dependent glycerol-3-phosphate dehydrogenase [Pararoseomonas indoligenes]